MGNGIMADSEAAGPLKRLATGREHVKKGYSRILVDRRKGRGEAFKHGIISEWFGCMLKTTGMSWVSPLRAGLRFAPLRYAGPRF